MITGVVTRAGQGSKIWHKDFGATDHMTFDRSLFETFEAVPPFDDGMGDNSTAMAHGRRTVPITLLAKGKPIECRLQNVALVLKLRHNLVSVSVIECQGSKIVFRAANVPLPKVGCCLHKV